MNDYQEPLSPWECYTPDTVFINCQSCAWQFAKDYGVELTDGLHTYGTNPANEDIGVSECYACGHEWDYVPTCDGCGAYLRGYLLPEAIEALKTEDYPQWLKDYYLVNN